MSGIELVSIGTTRATRSSTARSESADGASSLTAKPGRFSATISPFQSRMAPRGGSSGMARSRLVSARSWYLSCWRICVRKNAPMRMAKAKESTQRATEARWRTW